MPRRAYRPRTPAAKREPEPPPEPLPEAIGRREWSVKGLRLIAPVDMEAEERGGVLVPQYREKLVGGVLTIELHSLVRSMAVQALANKTRRSMYVGLRFQITEEEDL